MKQGDYGQNNYDDQNRVDDKYMSSNDDVGNYADDKYNRKLLTAADLAPQVRGVALRRGWKVLPWAGIFLVWLVTF